MSLIEKEGKTVEQAIDKGLKEMGLSRDEVQVEIVSLGSPGFLGLLGAKPAKVRLRVMSQPRIKRIVETILSKMGFPGTVRSFNEEGGRLTAVIESELGEKYLKANNGAVLDALEYLVGKIYHEAEQEIHLDIGDFRQSQGNQIKAMALEMAKKVAQSGQEHKFAPMPPHQRKIIHKALENHPEVKTFAVGEGDRRRVIIAPKKAGAQDQPKAEREQPKARSKTGGKESRPKDRPRAAAQGSRNQSRPAEAEKPRAAPLAPKKQPEKPAEETSAQTGFVPRTKKRARR